MDRDLEQELLNSPIGDLGSDDEHEGDCEGVQQMVPCYNIPGPATPLHGNYAGVRAVMPQQVTSLLSESSVSDSIMHSSSPPRIASFMEQVLRILDDAEFYHVQHIVSWQPDGVSFKVHRINDFETHILPRYLEQTKVRSFQRQLIKHGFKRIQGGAVRGSYHHPKFIRSDRMSCLSIEKVKRSRSFDGAEFGTPAVKLGEMSEHFRQAVLKSKPHKSSNCSDGSPTQGLQHQTESSSSGSARLGNTAQESSDPVSHCANAHSQVSRPDHLPFATPGLNSPFMSTVDFCRPPPNRASSFPSLRQTENLQKASKPPPLYRRTIPKAILSQFLPARPPGQSFATDFNPSELLSGTRSMSCPPKIDSPTEFEKYSLSNYLIPRSNLSISKIDPPQGRAMSPLDQTPDQDGRSTIWDI